ncbi:head maturation protease, ClpP-related [Streptomyces sp. MB09-02B]|uniref:head maturation protease, ClpP-related n=1 Tax=Streptomyces sp. MB09-02B TaxID=3028667 RepID=UPI0029AAD108|nr:head maturation protease, ClpP-related [Streptomyces sp. MB09-02B]MDX3643233.1 Clp protease ClpP [Streptomyces sp. MB09-02B]
MGKAHRCTNHVAPEELAERARATRPALPTPGGEQTWYRISNALDEGGTPYASISVYGDIGSWGITASSFMEELKAVDAPEIRLSISSPGGDLFDGLAIHNALRSHRAKVVVQVDALAASIASVIAMAGDRIIAAPHSQFMIHNAAGVAAGEATELREYADFLDKQSENIAGVYAERAGGTVKHWLKLMAAETWFFAEEAVAAGLADEVGKPERQMGEEADDRAIAAAWDLNVYNYAHTSREQAPPPPLPVTVEVRVEGEAFLDVVRETVANRSPEPAPVFDPAAFRAAAVAALDPMPNYQPDHMRSLMAGLASDAPAPEASAPPEAPYVPPPVDAMPEPDAETVAVGWFRSLFTAAANDAPAPPQPERPSPAAPVPQTVYVPEPPPPANEVAVDYMRTLMANAANDLAAPEQAAASGPAPAEPVPAIDPKSFERSLKEARL